MQEIWTEKYRPHDFDEVVGQDEIVKRVKAFVREKNLPHLLFAGPAGTGKSSLALIIAKKLFSEKWRENYLELNASDARGIDVIRQQVKSFARTKAIGIEMPKIIFLDEADALTKEAQNALRRTMENFTATCRFILSCNYSSKIIVPIQSRCAIFRFKLLSREDIKKIVEKISKNEKLDIEEGAIDLLYEVSEGDCRMLINLLQASAVISRKITEALVYEIVAKARPAEIRDIIREALGGNFSNAREKLLDVMLKEGLAGIDVLKAIGKEIWNLDITDELKVKLTEKIGEIEFRLVEGSDEFVQLEALLAYLVHAGMKTKK